MKGFHTSFLGLALLIYYSNADVEVADGTLLEDGYHYKKSNSNSNSNSYSQFNEENVELDGVLNGRTYKGEKKSGYSTSGESHAFSSSYAVSSFGNNQPSGLISTPIANSANGAALAHLGSVNIKKPEFGNLNFQSTYANSNGIGTQISPDGHQVNYWWMSKVNPFKPQGGCNSNGCSISGVFPNTDGREVVGTAVVTGPTGFTSSSTAVQTTGIKLNKNNPFFSNIHGKPQETNIPSSSISSDDHLGTGSIATSDGSLNRQTNVNKIGSPVHSSINGQGSHVNSGFNTQPGFQVQTISAAFANSGFSTGSEANAPYGGHGNYNGQQSHLNTGSLVNIGLTGPGLVDTSAGGLNGQTNVNKVSSPLLGDQGSHLNSTFNSQTGFGVHSGSTAFAHNGFNTKPESHVTPQGHGNNGGSLVHTGTEEIGSIGISDGNLNGQTNINKFSSPIHDSINGQGSHLNSGSNTQIGFGVQSGSTAFAHNGFNTETEAKEPYQGDGNNSVSLIHTGVGETGSIGISGGSLNGQTNINKVSSPVHDNNNGQGNYLNSGSNTQTGLQTSNTASAHNGFTTGTGAKGHGNNGVQQSHLISGSLINTGTGGTGFDNVHGGIINSGNAGTSSHSGTHGGFSGHISDQVQSTTENVFGVQTSDTPSSGHNIATTVNSPSHIQHDGHGNHFSSNSQVSVGNGGVGSSSTHGSLNHGGYIGTGSHGVIYNNINEQIGGLIESSTQSEFGVHNGEVLVNQGGHINGQTNVNKVSSPLHGNINGQGSHLNFGTSVTSQSHGLHSGHGSHFNIGSHGSHGNHVNSGSHGGYGTHLSSGSHNEHGSHLNTGTHGGHGGHSNSGFYNEHGSHLNTGSHDEHGGHSNSGFYSEHGSHLSTGTHGGHGGHSNSGFHGGNILINHEANHAHGINHNGHIQSSSHGGINTQSGGHIQSNSHSGAYAGSTSSAQAGLIEANSPQVDHVSHAGHGNHFGKETNENHGHVGIVSQGGLQESVNQQYNDHFESTTASTLGVQTSSTTLGYGGFTTGSSGHAISHGHGSHSGHGSHLNSGSDGGTVVINHGSSHTHALNHDGQIGDGSHSGVHGSGHVQSTIPTETNNDSTSSGYQGLISDTDLHVNHGSHDGKGNHQSSFGVENGGNVGIISQGALQGSVSQQHGNNFESTTASALEVQTSSTVSGQTEFSTHTDKHVASQGHGNHATHGNHYGSNSHSSSSSTSVDLSNNHSGIMYNKPHGHVNIPHGNLNGQIGSKGETINYNGFGSQIAQGAHTGHSGISSSHKNGITTITDTKGNLQNHGIHAAPGGAFNYNSSHNVVANTNSNSQNGNQGIFGGQGYAQPLKPHKPFVTGYTINCNGLGRICVAKTLCINGYTNLIGVTQVNNKDQKCEAASEVCCTLKKVQQSGANVPNHPAGLTPGGSAPGGLFGSGGESDGDLSAGDNSGSVGEAANGYLPPLGSSSSSNVPAFSQPPQKPQDPNNDNSPSNNQQQFQFPPVQPQLGCAAALICVEEQFCNMIGTISETPVVLTKEQLLRRVPLVDCRNPDNGVIGKCCRDPNYVDPWPAGNLPANYSGGFDDQGFPTFLNLSKNKPKKPIRPIQPFQQSLLPSRNQPVKIIPQHPQPVPSVNSPSHSLQPQSSFQTTKITPNQFKQPFQQQQNIIQKPRPFQPQQPQESEQPQQFLIPQKPLKVQQPVNLYQLQPEKPQQQSHFQFQKPQQPHQSHQPENFHFQQPQQPNQPDQLEESLPSDFEQSHQPLNQPSKFSQPLQPGKTFDYPNVPAFQEIPNQITNQISNLNPFRPRPPKPTEQPQNIDIISGSGDVSGVNLPTTTKRPGLFPNLPSFPHLPSFPGIGKGHDSSPTNQSPVVIAPHTPGAQCGIINHVRQPGALSDVDVAFGEIPWQAMILSNTEKKLLCSGVIVAPNLVLTAATCVYGLNPNEVSIKAGEWKLGYDLKHEEPLPFEIIEVESIVPHPNFQLGSPSFDTALLFLQKPIKLDLHVDTICIGDAPAISTQRKCISTGWGKTILQIHAAGALMHRIDVDLLSNEQCSQRLQGAESSIDIDDSLVCAKAHRQNNNMCQVDFGGPLACDRGDGNYELVGVYNQDTGCLPTNQVATFALIDTKWVKAMIEQPRAPPTQAIFGNKATPIEDQQAPIEDQQAPIEEQQVPSRVHYHPNQPDVPCDCQQGSLPSGANQYLPPV